MTSVAQIQNQLHLLDLEPASGDSKAEILEGLTAAPKRLSPKYFYDHEGSRLFEKITQLPEYYPTRTEAGLYRRFGTDMAAQIGTGSVILELGSGNAEKIRLLLEDLAPSAYVSVDISRDFLIQSGQRLVAAFPWLEVYLVCGDYTRPWSLPDEIVDRPLAAFYPGSTIGNFDPSGAIDFLRNLAAVLGAEGQLLIGVDLQKDPEVLHAAYNDSAGVTAAFNRNILLSVNRLAAGDFDPADFSHLAIYNAEEHRIEMYLEARREHQVRIAGEAVHFARGERIHTENSYKYTVEGFQTLAAQAGFRSTGVWTDALDYFGVMLLEVAERRGSLL